MPILILAATAVIVTFVLYDIEHRQRIGNRNFGGTDHLRADNRLGLNASEMNRTEAAAQRYSDNSRGKKQFLP